MRKEWYIFINDQKEGPYSLLELKRDERLTPDTLVWKTGLEKWTKIREVPELKELFKDPKASSAEEEAEKLRLEIARRDDSVIALSYDPFNFWFWMLVGALLIFYMLHKLGWFDL